MEKLIWWSTSSPIGQDLQNGVNADHVDKGGNTALILAACQNQRGIVKALLNALVLM